MKPIPYKYDNMNNVILKGTNGVNYIGQYIDMRIDRETVPEGKYAYDCRHGDENDWVTPVTIEQHVIVNFAGTFISDIPIEFPKELYIELDDWEFTRDESVFNKDYFQVLPSPDVMEAYVDGSYNKSIKTYGSACIIFHNGKYEELTSSGCQPDKATMRNVAGEIDAAMMAFKKAYETPGVTNLVIYHDYTGIKCWCTGEWKTNKVWTQQYKSYFQEVSSKLIVTFVKVAAHTDDSFNNHVDKLAKRACGVK